MVVLAEGDTIVRAARRLEPVLVGREIASASAPNPRSPLKRAAGRLEGQKVEAIETRGKHLILHLSDGLSLHSHMGMNGSWRVDTGRGLGKPDRNAWLLLETSPAQGPAPRIGQFGGTTLRLVRTVELERDQRLARLGPDILAADFDVEAAGARLREHPEQIGVALLDQRLVCGIGNIFKSESCFETRIDPWRDSVSLAPDEATSLLETARRQMEIGVETGKRPFRVYKHAGRPCPRCLGSRIRSRAQGDDGRITYWCPKCQS